jgi:hypothetical protein
MTIQTHTYRVPADIESTTTLTDQRSYPGLVHDRLRRPTGYHSGARPGLGDRVLTGKFMVVPDVVEPDPVLSEFDRAIVELVRTALAGNWTASRRAVRQLLRHTPAASHGDLRAALGTVLASASRLSGSARPSRMSLDDAAAPMDPELPHDADTHLPVALLAKPLVGGTLVLPGPAGRQVERLIAERQHAEKLASAGLTPTRTVLLCGPPGVGKTHTAHHLARHLELPLVIVDLATVMSSYLGRTGQNLRAALDHARTRSCVVLLDEFDALAKRRDDDTDIGELKRLVNVLLLELERWPAHSLLIAATNHPELLDRAVGRRFDTLINLDLPDRSARERLLHAYLWADAESSNRAMVTTVSSSGQERPTTRGRLETALVELVATMTDGWSGSDLQRLAFTARRYAALDDRDVSETLLDHLVGDLAGDPVRGDTSRRDAFIKAAHHTLFLSNRRIAALLGVSHPTVARVLATGRANEPADSFLGPTQD